jgi:DNA-directed RNA polymerase II subunit RPB1
VAHAVGNELEHATLSRVVTTSAIYYDPDPKETIIKADEELLEFHNMTSLDEVDTSCMSPWIIRLELDASKMMGRSLRIEDIDNKLHEELPDGQVNIVRHRELQENSGKLVLRLRLLEFLADEDDEETVPMLLKQAEERILNELTLQGFPEITKVAYASRAPPCKIKKYKPETGAQYTEDKNWIIETDGVALKKIMAVTNVDAVKTVSNDIIEILTVLGVEAARLSLIAELRFVLGSYGIYVNYRHLATLCDIMTTRGILTAITRHGINRIDSGALRKASFEETVEIILEAAQHAEVDTLSGVTENIIFGQLAPYGTGAFDVIMDTDMLKEANDGNIEEPNMAMMPNHGFDDFIAGTPEHMMTP